VLCGENPYRDGKFSVSTSKIHTSIQQRQKRYIMLVEKEIKEQPSCLHLALRWKAMLNYAFIGIKLFGGFEEFKTPIDSILGTAKRSRNACISFACIG
jgi:hypothetical protein